MQDQGVGPMSGRRAAASLGQDVPTHAPEPSTLVGGALRLWRRRHGQCDRGEGSAGGPGGRHRPARAVADGPEGKRDGAARPERVRQEHADARDRGHPGGGLGRRHGPGTAGRKPPAATEGGLRDPGAIGVRRPDGAREPAVLRARPGRPRGRGPVRPRHGGPACPGGSGGRTDVGRPAVAGLAGGRAAGAARPAGAGRARPAARALGHLPRADRERHDHPRLQPRHGRGGRVRAAAADARRSSDGGREPRRGAPAHGVRGPG